LLLFVVGFFFFFGNLMVQLNMPLEID